VGAHARSLVLALLALIPSLSCADVAVPDTPAGKALSEFLDAVNSGDPARQESFLQRWPSRLSVSDIDQWYRVSGGYDLLEVRSSDSTNVFFRIKQRSRDVVEAGRLQVSAETPVSLKMVNAWRMPPGATWEPLTLDDAARARVIESAAVILERFHIDAKTGERLAAELRQRLASGEYRDIPYGDWLAKKVTSDLRDTVHDDHLQLRFSYWLTSAESTAKQDEEEARQAVAANCFFEKAEHLEGNIGYLKFNVFADAAACGSKASEVMDSLADSDALIFDLRDNRGGRGEMGERLASYLFAKRTHLSDAFRRADNVTTASWTTPHVPGSKFLGKPVYVLISGRTFSAGEGFAFVLQAQKRATIVGEATVGGSGTIEFKPVDGQFTVVVPTGRVTSPVSKADFVRTGVIPDIKAPADEALEVALKLAAQSRHGSRPGAGTKP
jgi:hypothetical protein